MEKDLESDYDEHANVKEMTPDEQKDYLVEVGKEFIATFNPEDQQGTVELAAGLYNKYQNWDWEVIGEQMEDEFNKLDAQGFFRMPARIAALVTGEATTMDTKEFLISFAVAGRLFEFDEKTKTMKVSETKDGSIVARFKDEDGTDCELKVWGEGKTTTVTFTYDEYRWEDEYDDYGNYVGSKKIYEGTRIIKAEVPAEIHMYLKQGSTTIMSVEFAWESNFKDYVNHSLSMKITNITWNQELKASTKEASAAFSLMYGDTKLIVAAVDLPKYKLIDWEGGKDITLEEGESWIEQYDDQYKTILGSLGKGEGVVDIMGKVRGKMSVSDGAGFYDAMTQWENTNYATDLEDETAYCGVYNNYIHVGLYYGGKTEQARVKMQPTYSYTNDYGEDRYNSVPVLYFPKDGTTYEVVTFFESAKFNVLIDLAEDLVNAYKDLDTGHLLFDGGRIELN
ncbi:MAG: hypothetical protein ACI30J_09915 [Paludibacteraceae bacterium]